MLQPETKKSFYIFILAWIALYCFAYYDSAIASTISITTKGQLLDIEAKKIPLIDILKSISDETALIIESSDSLEELVSIDMNGVSLEDCLRQLLGKRNYIIMLTENEKKQTVPEMVCIFGSGTTIVIGRNAAKPADDQIIKYSSMKVIENNGMPPMDEHVQKYKKGMFESFLQDSKKLDKQISATPFSDETVTYGVLMTNVSEDSLFSEIGIRKGDIISDINGLPVNTVTQLINQLHPPAEQSIIRIERRNNTGEIDPIYIQLQ